MISDPAKGKAGQHAHPRLEPIVKLDNVGVLHALKHLQLIVDHLFVAAHILLQNDLDGHLALGAVSLPHDAIGTGTQCLSEAVSGSAIIVLSFIVACEALEGRELSIVAFGLTVQLVEHICHYNSVSAGVSSRK